MISFALLLALMWQFYLGYSRGLVKQIYLLVAFIISILLAQANYQALTEKITFWIPYTQATEEKVLTFFPQVHIFDMDKVFYAGVAFLGIALAVYLTFRLLAVFLHFFPLDYFDNHRFNLVSGGLSVLLTLFFWSMTFNLLATIPFEQVQRLVTTEPLMTGLIRLPLLSPFIRGLWLR